MFEKFKYWKFSKQRTEGYSDAVYAIIITILILEIRIPHLESANSGTELANAIWKVAPKIISWMVSFFFISVMWTQHHNLFRMAEKIDYGFVWINSTGLFFLCFLPFPMSLMGEYPGNRLAVLLFGLNTFLATLTQVWLYYYLVKNYLSPHFDKKSAMKNVRIAFFFAPILLLLATILSFVSIMLTIILYGVVPLLFLLPLDKEKLPADLK